jgi:lipopolysaccharide transport system ATP-binding protein
MNTIRELCDRVIVLDHGKVVFDGDVEEGIAVYIGKNVEGAYTHYELENLKRPGLLGTIHRLQVLDFLNKDKAEYDNLEIIFFIYLLKKSELLSLTEV